MGGHPGVGRGRPRVGVASEASRVGRGGVCKRIPSFSSAVCRRPTFFWSPPSGGTIRVPLAARRSIRSAPRGRRCDPAMSGCGEYLGNPENLYPTDCLGKGNPPGLALAARALRIRFCIQQKCVGCQLLQPVRRFPKNRSKTAKNRPKNRRKLHGISKNRNFLLKNKISTILFFKRKLRFLEIP